MLFRSEEERSSYIGIYRLIRQVENTDGAAIGALIQQGSPLTMKNLLTAVRSEKRSNKMDYSVDSDFNGVSGTSNGSSITDQIEAAYQNNCLKDASELLTPERAKVLFDQDSDWENMTPEEFKAALELAKEILRLLKFRSEQELAEWYAWNKFGLYSPGHKGRTPSGL